MKVVIGRFVRDKISITGRLTFEGRYADVGDERSNFRPVADPQVLRDLMYCHYVDIGLAGGNPQPK